MTPLELVLGKLPHHRKLSDSLFEARCPGHDDSGFTLAVGLRDDGRPELWCRNGCRHEDLLRELELGPRDAVDHFEEAPPREAPRQGRPPIFEGFESFCARADAEPDPQWLIEPLFHDAGAVLLVAEPNAGKTWLALLACANATKDGRDVFIVEEEGRAKTLAFRLRKFAAVGRHVHIAHRRQLLLDDAGQRKQLLEAIHAGNRPVVMLDPLAQLHRGDENKTQDASTLLRYLGEVLKTTPGALLIVCHHASKRSGAPDGASEVYAGRGSSTFPAWFDEQLNLAPIVVPEGSERVSFSVTVAKARESAKGLKRDVVINLQPDPAEVTMDVPVQKKAADIRGAISFAFKSAPSGLTRNAVVEAVGKRKADVLEEIGNMLREGLLIANGKVIQFAAACDS